MQTLLDAPQIFALVGDIAKRIGVDYPSGVVLAPVLRGGMTFCADLARRLPGDVRIAPVIARRRVESVFGDTLSVEVAYPYPHDYVGQNVIIVDTVIDSGLTIAEVRRGIAELDARTTSVACLLWKRERTTEPTALPEYCGRVIGDLYVVGYGLDNDERDRNLAYISTLDTAKRTR